MAFNFDAGDIELDDIQAKSLSAEQMETLSNQIKDDLGTAETVGQVLAVLTKASMIALKLGVLAA